MLSIFTCIIILLSMYIYVGHQIGFIIFFNMKAFVILAIVLPLILGRTYPLYKQCDPKWGSHQLGTSSKTICQAGCLISSVAMALTGIGQHKQDPGTINTWLKAHNGYVSGDAYVWNSVHPLGITFEGKVGNSAIKSQLDKGKVVILNVHNGGHWVLAHSYTGDTIHVNDPGYPTTSYTLSEIVNGQTGIYKVG